jgi:FKBP-type peptidyl-prolyl cis-trans isomerase
MATSTAHRVIAGVGAILFLVTSLGFSGLVIWQIHKDNEANKATSSQNTPVNQQNQQNKASEGNKLEGTKLAGFTPVDKVDTLQKIDLKAGSGEAVKAGATVTAHYTGALAKTGVIFQSSHDSGQPFTSPLSNLIKGWQDGIPGMKVGGTRRLLIPAAEAYGSNEQPGIPANSDLVFDIELISISK